MDRPFVLGLTGSAAMGKSTAAAMLRAEGVPVWDADAAVHALYGPDGAGTRAVAALRPEAVGPGGVDRARLRAALRDDPGLLARLEAAIHPLVAADRARFLADHRGAALVALDVPLLFETGLDAVCDGVAVVSAPEAVQRARLRARPGLGEAEIALLLARQMPDAAKRARARWIIPGDTLDGARAAVRDMLAEIRGARGGGTGPEGAERTG
ncbi:dephospho-CoA kinase [Rubellimicrobium sp. CFH 75288]|uniref:dephospho-CoA kinase n=1 Tax=Rubellimicrobium sp. CFH 75288 TaxID=2697034 RepID=UPI0014133438|nr:dephospho-CoA kinase [Rubellimicrobium sp. CFH 75288]NAZ37774.1 dephospho-CoA kinase [Rubellimicrobium sp. CFH 75288]